MTERRDMHEGLDPAAAAALRALREEEAVPDAARERVWARLAAETGAADEATGPKRQGSWARSSGTWTIVALAAAALVLLASRVGVIDRLVASRGGEAAPYTEVERAGGGAAVVEAERAVSGAQAPAAGDRAVEAARPAVEARAVEAAPAAAVTGPEGHVPQGEAASPEGHVRKDVAGETPAEGRAGRRAGRTTQGGAASEARPAEEEAGALAAEAEALARAQAAIQDGEAAAALDELAAYARRFPHGVLREEHDALRAIALCSDGRSREGRGEAQAFLRARPASALAERVRGACLAP